MHDKQLLLKQRLADVEERLTAACQRAGRKRSEVTLLAVTKTVNAEVAALLFSMGVGDLGESRPQELWLKASLVPAAVRWHLIGHLQRNKIERTLPIVSRVHSVDSRRLLDALEAEAAKCNRVLPVFLEINTSGEANKTGMPPEELGKIVPRLGSFQNIRVDGLMTMAAYAADPAECRPTFALLRQLRERWRGEIPAPHALDHLSMGMSNDFEIAVEEGSTFVRLGTVLFAGLEDKA